MHHLHLAPLLTSSDPSEFSSRRALEDISLAIAKCRKAIVMSGAGISCSSGIPDFRSTDGLYSLVKARYPDTFVTGKDLFSASLFSTPQTSSIFYTFIAELTLACAKATPTRTHHFIQKLESKNKLLRNYTQNIDGFERRLGMESGGRGRGLHKKTTRNVELHGDLGRVRCVLCWTDYEARLEWTQLFREGDAPDCPSCQTRCAARVSRSARAVPIGTLRPSIVLYDESHPLGDDIGLLQTYDMTRSPDILIIMGTSLKVHGFKKLVKDFARSVHSGKKGIVVYVNATPPSKEWTDIIDYFIQGETDKWVEKVEDDWRRLKPTDWETQTRLENVSVVATQKTKINLSSGQLPTPSPSVSPPRGCSSRFSSPLSSLPSSPLSPPSPKRPNANTLTSPTKKPKPAPPPTSLPPSPGCGNLFYPSPPNSQEPPKPKPKSKSQPKPRGKENNGIEVETQRPVRAVRALRVAV